MRKGGKVWVLEGDHPFVEPDWGIAPLMLDFLLFHNYKRNLKFTGLYAIMESGICVRSLAISD
jgi:hypothetical protein